MLNKLRSFLRQQEMVQPGDIVICALSGGADSVAMTFAFYLIKEELGISLEAAHFNHQLREEESDRDEAFVRAFCDHYEIPLHVGRGAVKIGKKGLEAAARDARYSFLKTLNGKIATAHTADDNAETVLLHLIRGTGLKGLGGITPIHGKVIRPMLTVTRQDVEDFLEEWCVGHIEDSSNETDAFLRNRIRHHVMPLLRKENPRIGENLSQMALRLRQDEECLSQQAQLETLPTVQTLKTLHPAVRSRVLASYLKKSGVKEPEDAHIAQAEALLYAEKPSARAQFPGGVTIARNYDRLEVLTEQPPLEEMVLPCPGMVTVGSWQIRCKAASEIRCTTDAFTVCPKGPITIRSRRSGDSLRLAGGRKTLKKLFIDRKIPAAQRDQMPILCDEDGILGVCSIGANLDRIADTFPAVTIKIEKKETEHGKRY